MQYLLSRYAHKESQTDFYNVEGSCAEVDGDDGICSLVCVHHSETGMIMAVVRHKRKKPT